MAEEAAAEGVALFNAGRRWEAHVAWEVAWHAAPPGFPVETAAFRSALEHCVRGAAPVPRAALAGAAAHTPRTDRP